MDSFKRRIIFNKSWVGFQMYPRLQIPFKCADICIVSFSFWFAGINADGKKIFLENIWPSRSEIQEVEEKYVIPSMFHEVYACIENGSNSWQSLVAPEGQLYPWDTSSTYIKKPPFFDGMTKVSYHNRVLFSDAAFFSFGPLKKNLSVL